MATPFILINLKTYTEGFGHNAQKIAQSAERIAHENDVRIGLAPGYMDIHPLNVHYSLPVFAQHVDAVSPGAHTGHIVAEAVKAAGATGTLINHSERRLTLADVESAHTMARAAGLETVICTNNVATSGAAAFFSPDYIAIEPPELIGSGVSVSKADPEIIERSVEAVRSVRETVKVLTGAGISTGECVKTALDLGTDGVLLASGVVKAKDPEAVLRDLVSKI
ncbi:triose-phosphate isomerase [Methanogenium organophilum]|uniref:Triosephosphate isomerase n=1 Tax=Methanogenium organophilum TaxID=2199 RepID=A0A9X9T8C4_METOG|nr:triose-phosphate isomerase [Methanogenium organophilum]WAI01017.1 triose-phosphate isomerase [Methanogenium organophilum]